MIYYIINTLLEFMATFTVLCSLRRKYLEKSLMQTCLALYTIVQLYVVDHATTYI